MIVAGLTVDEAFKYSIMNTCLGFIGVNVGIYLMRYVVGRRTILMIGAFIQGCWMLGMAISATVEPGTLMARNCLIAFSALYMFSYNAFVGDASYPVATELVSTRLRSWSVGSAISLGYVLAWLTGFCSPYFINPEKMNWVRHERGYHFLLNLLIWSIGRQIRIHLGRFQLLLPDLLLLLHS